MTSDPGPRSGDERILIQYLEALDEAGSEESRAEIRRDFRRRHPGLTKRFDDLDEPLKPDMRDPNRARPLIERLEGGRFEFRGVLGQGGMGVVYHAFDRLYREEVAVKMVLLDGEGREARGRRFLHEVKFMESVVHPNVINFRGSGNIDGHPYFVMDLLGGPTLLAHLEKNAPLHPRAVTRLGEELARGLAELHRRNLAHRDVKPGNVGLETLDPPPRRGGWPFRAVLMDLGLVRDVKNRTTLTALTRTGVLVGTPGYIAPEQITLAEVEEPYRCHCDLFALGCVLYEAATGRKAFDGESDWEVLLNILTAVPKPPHRVNRAVPKKLSRFILRLLEKKPERRPRSAEEAADALRNMRRWSGPLGLFRRVLTLPWRTMWRVWGLAWAVLASVWFRRLVRLSLAFVAVVALYSAAVSVYGPISPETVSAKCGEYWAGFRSWVNEQFPGKERVRIQRVPEPVDPRPVVVVDVRELARSAPPRRPDRPFSVTVVLKGEGGAPVPAFVLCVEAQKFEGDMSRMEGRTVIGQTRVVGLGGAARPVEIPCVGRPSGIYRLNLRFPADVRVEYEGAASQWELWSK